MADLYNVDAKKIYAAALVKAKLKESDVWSWNVHRTSGLYAYVEIKPIGKEKVSISVYARDLI